MGLLLNIALKKLHFSFLYIPLYLLGGENVELNKTIMLNKIYLQNNYFY